VGRLTDLHLSTDSTLVAEMSEPVLEVPIAVMVVELGMVLA